MTRPTRRAAAATLALALALLPGCSGSEGADTPDAGSADPVASDLLNSARSPGMGMGATVPLAEGPATSTEGTPRSLPGPRQQMDLAVLGFNEGTAGAPVRVVEFSDFGCGYCRRFHEEIYPVLVEEYMETGKVEWKYVPMVIGMFPNALEAARAGECAGEQDRFPVMRDLLFARQQEWKQSDDPEPLLEGYAREVGLEMERFNNCVAQGWRDERIQAGTAFSRELGVRGTPTFFVVGYAPIQGAIPLELFRQVLDTVHVEATSRAATGG